MHIKKSLCAYELIRIEGNNYSLNSENADEEISGDANATAGDEGKMIVPYSIIISISNKSY